MNEDFVLQFLYIVGPSTHKDLQEKLDCGFHAIDNVLRSLCKKGLVHHEELYRKKGYKNDHLFWVIKTQ